MYGLGTINPGQRHGRWSEDEHQQFLSLMQKYGRSWTKISQVMMTRSEPQVRSHAQKHFLRISRLEKQAVGERCKDKDITNSKDQLERKHDPNSESGKPEDPVDFVKPTLSRGEPVGTGDETRPVDKQDRGKRMKRRRILGTYSTVATNLGMFGGVPDAAALVTMAAQAAIAQGQQASSHVSNATNQNEVSGNTVPAGGQQSLLHTLALQQPVQTQGQSVPNSASYALLQNLHNPYALQQLHQASVGIQQMPSGHGMSPPSYYNYVPLSMRTDISLTRPSWNNMAVATTLGTVGSQSQWILPVTHVAHGGLFHATTNALAASSANTAVACVPDSIAGAEVATVPQESTSTGHQVSSVPVTTGHDLSEQPSSTMVRRTRGARHFAAGVHTHEGRTTKDDSTLSFERQDHSIRIDARPGTESCMHYELVDKAADELKEEATDGQNSSEPQKKRQQKSPLLSISCGGTACDGPDCDLRTKSTLKSTTRADVLANPVTSVAHPATLHDIGDVPSNAVNEISLSVVHSPGASLSESTVNKEPTVSDVPGVLL